MFVVENVTLLVVEGILLAVSSGNIAIIIIALIVVEILVVGAVCNNDIILRRISRFPFGFADVAPSVYLPLRTKRIESPNPQNLSPK